MKALIHRLYRELDQERTLLRSALHELAVAKDPKHKERFISEWYRERRVRL